MQALKPLAVVFSLLAFASVSAFADDAKKDQASSPAKPSMSQSTSSGGASAGGSSSTKSSGATRLDFDKADKDHDGKLSRAEFDAMLKGDASASAGASAKPTQSKSSSGTK